MEAYGFEDGSITVFCCTAEQSIGTLTLAPGAALEVHSRPVDEQLLQVQGRGGLNIVDDGTVTEKVRFTPGDSYRIPAGQRHQHVNESDAVSTVGWRFDGDIRDIIQAIRDEHEPL